MALQYVQEHLSCNLYLTKHKIFIIRDACRGEIIQRTDPEKTALVFVEKGTILVKYGDGQELLAQTNKLYLLPALIQATHTALEDTRLLVCHFSGEIKLCTKFYLQQLTQHVAPNYRSMVYPLEANECIQTYARHLINALNEGLGCIHYHTIKRDEFFLYLRAGYTKEALARFFYPVLGKDINFKDFIIENHIHYKDVKNLANAMNLSLSSFNRKFKESFQCTAQDWLLERKSERVLADIKMSDLSFAEIAAKYHFSSPSYLTAFCKRQFHETPNEIRNHALTEFNNGGGKRHTLTQNCNYHTPNAA